MYEMNFFDLPHLQKLQIGVKRMARGESAEQSIHDHNFSEIALILEAGNALHWANGRSCPLARGDLLVLHPGLPHGYSNTAKMALVNLLYDPVKLPLPLLDGNTLPLLKRFLTPQNDANPEKPVAALTEETLESVNRLIYRLEEELTQGAPGKHLCSFGLFVSILVLLARSGKTGQMPSEKADSALPALYYLNLHPGKPLDIAYLARLCFLSRRSFFRRFREVSGVTPSEYQRQKRLELAETMLENSKLTLDTIAGRCGFCDTNHLIKLFSARYGMPPGKFRQLKQERKNDIQAAAGTRSPAGSGRRREI